MNIYHDGCFGINSGGNSMSSNRNQKKNITEKKAQSNSILDDLDQAIFDIKNKESIFDFYNKSTLIKMIFNSAIETIDNLQKNDPNDPIAQEIAVNFAQFACRLNDDYHIRANFDDLFYENKVHLNKDAIEAGENFYETKVHLNEDAIEARKDIDLLHKQLRKKLESIPVPSTKSQDYLDSDACKVISIISDILFEKDISQIINNNAKKLMRIIKKTSNLQELMRIMEKIINSEEVISEEVMREIKETNNLEELAFRAAAVHVLHQTINIFHNDSQKLMRIMEEMKTNDKKTITNDVIHKTINIFLSIHFTKLMTSFESLDFAMRGSIKPRSNYRFKFNKCFTLYYIINVIIMLNIIKSYKNFIFEKESIIFDGKSIPDTLEKIEKKINESFIVNIQNKPTISPEELDQFLKINEEFLKIDTTILSI